MESKKAHIPPLKISGIKSRYNAVGEIFYEAIKFCVLDLCRQDQHFF